jgi:hypothetical protein
VFGDKALDCIATQRRPPSAREHRLLWVNPGLLTKPGIEHTGDVAAQWSAAPFPPLALAANVRAGAQDHVVASQSNQLGHPESCLNSKEQECAVSSANPSASVRSGKKHLDFFAGEELHWPALEPLARNGEHPLTEQRVRGLSQRDVFEEAVNRSQTRIAGTRAVPALSFEVVEELRYERCIDVFESEAGR